MCKNLSKSKERTLTVLYAISVTLLVVDAFCLTAKFDEYHITTILIVVAVILSGIASYIENKAD